MWDKESEFDAVYDKGLTELMRGDLISAEKTLMQSLQLNPNSHVVHYQLGRCYLRLGKLLKAQEELEIAIRIQAEHIPSLAELGFVYLCQDRIAEAGNIFKKAVDLRSNHGKSLIGMSVCSFSSGNWAEAYEWALKAVQLGGSHFMALYLLAKAEKVLGHLQESEEHFKKSEELLEKTTEVAPEQPESYFMRGEIALIGEFYNKAYELFCEVENRMDKNREYYFYHEKFNYITILNKQGICLKQLGKKEEAKKIGTKILQLDPENKLAKLLLTD
ncbi:MAG TPA: CDC27 family protein [Candidatus Hydrogenedens sp.]|nr:CDC27 family protein [Candidatus Hydrogenedens sp.]